MHVDMRAATAIIVGTDGRSTADIQASPVGPVVGDARSEAGSGAACVGPTTAFD